MEISVRIEISTGFTKNLKILSFWIFKFCFHEATLGADLASCACAIDMVDGVLDTLGDHLDNTCINKTVVALLKNFRGQNFPLNLNFHTHIIRFESASS